MTEMSFRERFDLWKSSKLMMTQHRVGSSQYRIAKITKKIIDYEDGIEEAKDCIRMDIHVEEWTKTLENSTKKLEVWKNKKKEWFKKQEEFQRNNPCY
jgi:hypothetical protein